MKITKFGQSCLLIEEEGSEASEKQKPAHDYGPGRIFNCAE